MRTWQSRLLDAVYPAILIDMIVLKIRSVQVANRPVYVRVCQEFCVSGVA